MKEIIEIVALFLGFASWILILVSLQDQYWKESTTEGSVITTSTIYENLWMSCASDSTGIYNCRDFPSLFALPGYIQASRALMIAAIVFGTFGLVATLVGMQCSKIGGENYILKGRIAAIGGAFFLLQGKDLAIEFDDHIKKRGVGSEVKIFLCFSKTRSQFFKRIQENVWPQ
ncbi:claudin-15-like isoform X1 [Xyrichtys novacula]|uniref:Claudin n=1 Tax=Xyrichtys novacula TaxID=13765 RepID=A0AAV1FSC4_XYRNO|nr:claudin-15-like isoform X1 [Xyrichtys novacula]